jgi:predicted HTH domain antitoxin
MALLTPGSFLAEQDKRLLLVRPAGQPQHCSSHTRQEAAMSALTSKELEQQPERLLDDARRGTPDVVTVQGEPIMLTLPLGQATGSSAERLALAVSLYERDVLSLGLAAKVAGLSCSQMIDELGRRQIPVVRYSTADLDRELDYVRTLAGGR